MNEREKEMAVKKTKKKWMRVVQNNLENRAEKKYTISKKTRLV